MLLQLHASLRIRLLLHQIWHDVFFTVENNNLAVCTLGNMDPTSFKDVQDD